MSKMITKLTVAVAVFFFAAVSLQAAKISAYYDAPYADAKTVKVNLEKTGFQVLTTYSPAGKENLKVLVFTNKALTSNASKKTRGFAAIQRALVDSKAKTVRVTNPAYWFKAFMQKDYKADSDKAITASITKALGKLTPTKDALNADDIAHYNYADAMPYYEDMLELKSGTALAINPKKVAFTLKLENGSTLVGVNMSKGSEKFIELIGEDKSLALPYTVLIEDGKAYALHAKYYLAISYPLLSLDEFMKISSTPDVIERKLKKSFK